MLINYMFTNIYMSYVQDQVSRDSLESDSTCKNESKRKKIFSH